MQGFLLKGKNMSQIHKNMDEDLNAHMTMMHLWALRMFFIDATMW